MLLCGVFLGASENLRECILDVKREEGAMTMVFCNVRGVERGNKCRVLRETHAGLQGTEPQIIVD